jgi:hypothetical protein
MERKNCQFDTPMDYCHGFAFVTLFGDQSRFIDAMVWKQNSTDGLTKNYVGADTNIGFYDDGYPESGCFGKYVYFKDGYTAWKYAKAPST